MRSSSWGTPEQPLKWDETRDTNLAMAGGQSPQPEEDGNTPKPQEAKGREQGHNAKPSSPG